MSIIVSRETPGQSVTNSVLFDSCHFNYNYASVVAVIDVSFLHPDLVTSNGLLMAPVFKDCQFVGNGLFFTDASKHQVPTAAVFANLVPLNFTGHNNFISNYCTALVVSGTYIILSNSSNMIFDSNTGRRGGAIAFIGNSWLVAYSNVQITFVNHICE